MYATYVTTEISREWFANVLVSTITIYWLFSGSEYQLVSTFMNEIRIPTKSKTTGEWSNPETHSIGICFSDLTNAF